LTDMRATNGLPLLVMMIFSFVYAARLAYSEKELLAFAKFTCIIVHLHHIL
jgi:hypothetical protein